MKREINAWIEFCMQLLFSGLIAVLLFITGCEQKNLPPTAKIEVSPISGEIPLEVRMRVTGEDPDGTEDIKQYVLYIGNESIKSNNPIDVTRTFTNEGKVNIYGEVIDSEGETNKTSGKTLELILTEGMSQSATVVNDNQIEYSATLKKKPSAELTVRKNGNVILTQQITDNSQTGPDFQKTFTYSADGITKGDYTFTLKSGSLEQKTSLSIPNYPPTINTSGINANLEELSKITVALPVPTDKNPEDNKNPIPITSVKPLDNKTQLTLNGQNLEIKAVGSNTGAYSFEINYGTTTGGNGKSVVQGNISKGNWKYVVNPFVQSNDSTLNWYGSGDVNKDNVINGQDLTRLNELISGTYSNPNDKRLNDRADVNGDGIVNNQDKQILENKLNGLISYLPAEWNKLNETQKKDWLRKMLVIDRTDELPGIPGEFVCTDFSRLLALNFNGYRNLGFDPLKGLQDNGRFNIPMYSVTILKPISFHQINSIILGEDFININNFEFNDPQSDFKYLITTFNEMNADKIVINYTRNTQDNQGVEIISMFEFIPDGNGGWKDSGYRNPEIKIITKRE